MRNKTACRICRKANHCQHGATLAEFGPALFILFIVILIPALNLIGCAWGMATAIFITNQSARAAAVSENYDSALSSATETAINLSNSYFGKLAHLKPVEGYNDSGVDLYIVCTNILTNKTSMFGPNLPLKSVVDTTNNVYEYQVQTKYEVSPFLNLAKAPMVNNIPLLSKATNLAFTSQQSAEYPNGLIGSGTNTGTMSAPQSDAIDSSNYNTSTQYNH